VWRAHPIGRKRIGRAILLSLEGWTSERISAAFCVPPDRVRHWRWIFGREGVAGLRARKARPRAGQGAGRLVGDRGGAGAGGIGGPHWTLPRLAEEIEKRTGKRISKSRLSVVLKKRASPGPTGQARGLKAHGPGTR